MRATRSDKTAAARGEEAAALAQQAARTRSALEDALRRLSRLSGCAWFTALSSQSFRHRTCAASCSTARWTKCPPLSLRRANAEQVDKAIIAKLLVTYFTKGRKPDVLDLMARNQSEWRVGNACRSGN